MSKVLRIEPRRVETHIPDLGDVIMRPAAFGMVRSAHEISSKVAEGDRANAFSNFLLASLFVEPEMSDERVADFSSAVLSDVVAAAVDVLEIHEQLDAIPGDLPLRGRFYQAYLEHEKELFKFISSTAEAAIKASRQSLIDAIGPTTKFAEDIARFGEGVQKMAALNLRMSIPSISASVLAPFAKEMDLLALNTKAIGQLVSEPMHRLAQDAAKLQLPEPYLSSALTLSGINSSLVHSPTYSIPTVRPFIEEADVEIQAEEVARQRLGEAYDTLVQLEQSLRGLIKIKLRDAHGDQWWKQRIPEDVRRECRDRKQSKEGPLDPSHHPISYAYVNDYKKIVVRRDNWREIFKPIFHNKGELETCFNWAGKARDSIAHIRPISDNAYLYFNTAAHWILVHIQGAQSTE